MICSWLYFEFIDKKTLLDLIGADRILDLIGTDRIWRWCWKIEFAVCTGCCFWQMSRGHIGRVHSNPHNIKKKSKIFPCKLKKMVGTSDLDYKKNLQFQERANRRSALKSSQYQRNPFFCQKIYFVYFPGRQIVICVRNPIVFCQSTWHSYHDNLRRKWK